MNRADRINREKKTVHLMISMHCKARHLADDGLCSACEDLDRYAAQRIERCRCGVTKPVCADCTVHCFKADMRDRIREAMRYSGPRMVLHHPILSTRHLLDRLASRPYPR